MRIFRVPLEVRDGGFFFLLRRLGFEGRDEEVTVAFDGRRLDFRDGFPAFAEEFGTETAPPQSGQRIRCPAIASFTRSWRPQSQVTEIDKDLTFPSGQCWQITGPNDLGYSTGNRAQSNPDSNNRCRSAVPDFVLEETCKNPGDHGRLELC